MAMARLMSSFMLFRSTEGIEPGWRRSRKKSAPEKGDVITASDRGFAVSNLFDAYYTKAALEPDRSESSLLAF